MALEFDRVNNTWKTQGPVAGFRERENWVDTETNPRFEIDIDGTHRWGSGSANPDTTLYRSAANSLITDDLFTATLGVLAGTRWSIVVEEVAFGATELGGTETNTSFTFTAGDVLLFAFIDVDDGESGTMDVGTQGTSNDPDGILDGIDLTNTGIIMPNVTFTTGLNATYISANTFGALTHTINAGSDAAGDEGGVVWAPKVITAADPVSITSSGDLDSCSGSLYLVIFRDNG